MVNYLVITPLSKESFEINSFIVVIWDIRNGALDV